MFLSVASQLDKTYWFFFPADFFAFSYYCANIKHILYKDKLTLKFKVKNQKKKCANEKLIERVWIVESQYQTLKEIIIFL